MDNNKNDFGHVDGCQCHMCGGFGFHRYHLLRWLLGLFILTLVFALGVKLGEFKGFMEAGGWNNFDSRMPFNSLMPSGGTYFYKTWSPAMMQQASPVTSTTTPKKK